MPESTIGLTPGSGVKVHSWQRTIGANTVEDDFSLPGEFPYPSYTVIANNISIATANDHVLQIMAGASLNVRIRSVSIEQNANATTAARVDFQLLRLTTAGTGGSSITPRASDPADSASGCTAMSLPTAKGTESFVLDESILVVRQGVSTTQTNPEETILWTPPSGFKSHIIPAGTSNGVAVKVINATAAATVTVVVKLVETSFV